MKLSQNVEPVEEASTSTRYTISNRFSEDPPEEMVTVLVGTCGCWRVILMIIFCITMTAYGLHMFSIKFLHPRNVKFNCTQNNADQNQINPCYTSNGNFCTNFSFDEGQEFTITKKYELICDNGLRITIINFGFKFGMISGYILFGILSDKYGRKNIFTISLVSQLCVGILISAYKNYLFYAIYQYLHGIFLAGMVLLATVLTCDISSNKCRTINIGLLCISISMGCLLLPFIWMVIHKYLKSLSILYCLHFFLLFFICCVKESPSWLLCKNKASEAENVLTLVARLNGIKRSSFRIRPVQITRIDNRTTINFCHLLKTSMRNMVMALFFIWCFMYVMHSANKNNNFIKINDDILRTKIMGSIGICAAILSILMCHFFKHKIAIALASILTCLISIATCAISKEIKNIKDEWNMVLILQLSSYGVSKLLIFTVFNMTPRVFPTELRCRGTAAALAIGEFSYIVADIIFVYCLHTSFVIMAIIVFICTLLILLAIGFLYSTHNRELPDLLEDSMNFKSNYKPIRWTTLRPISATTEEVAVKVIDFEKGTSVSVPYKKRNGPKKKTHNKSTQD